jgi:NADH:ubiquinone oxidoreductase subunit H
MVKSIIKFSGVLFFTLLFIGCSSNNSYDSFDKVTSTKQKQIFEIEKDVFVKGIILNLGTNEIGAEMRQTIYVFCDKNGKVLKEGGINFTEQNGKTVTNVSVI